MVCFLFWKGCVIHKSVLSKADALLVMRIRMWYTNSHINHNVASRICRTDCRFRCELTLFISATWWSPGYSTQSAYLLLTWIEYVMCIIYVIYVGHLERIVYFITYKLPLMAVYTTRGYKLNVRLTWKSYIYMLD